MAKAHTSSPIVVGSSVLAIKYKEGVIMAADTLCSYGNSARFKGIDRMAQAGEKTLMGFSGELSDFQQVQIYLREIDDEDWNNEDGIRYGAKQHTSYLSRILYNKRCKANPLWVQMPVGGMQVDADGKEQPYLSYVDMYGSTFEEDYVTTGFGAHLALPLIRDAWHKDMTEQEARDLLEKCLTVLYYRDCRASPKVKFAKVSAAGVEIGEEKLLASNWSFDKWTRPTAGNAAVGGTW